MNGIYCLVILFSSVHMITPNIEKSIQNEAMYWYLSRMVRKGIIDKIVANIFFIHVIFS